MNASVISFSMKPVPLQTELFFLWFKTTTVAEVAGEDYIMQAVLFAFDRAYLSDTVTVRTFPERLASRSRTVVRTGYLT
jgi:hypothetical protein